MNTLVYFLFFSVPFVNRTISGNFLLIDIPTFLLMLSTIPHLNHAIKKGLHRVDYLILFYIGWGVVSVVMGSNELYDSAREFRWLVLLPCSIYFGIRFSFVKFSVITKGFFFILPGTFYQGGLILTDFIRHGTRPQGVEGTASLITLSLLFSICFGIVFFLTKDKKNFKSKTIKLIVLVFFAFALFATFSRASLISSIFLLVLLPFIWRKTRAMAILPNIVTISLIVLIILVILNLQIPIKTPFPFVDIREIQHSSSRLSNVWLYLIDINERIGFWSYTVSLLDNIFLGNGFAARTIGYSQTIGFSLGSPHNFLITSLLTGGYPFLILTLLIVHFTLKSFTKSNWDRSTNNSLGKFLLYSFCVTLSVALTNDLSGRRVVIFFLLIAVIVRQNINYSNSRRTLKKKTPPFNNKSNMKNRKI